MQLEVTNYTEMQLKVTNHTEVQLKVTNHTEVQLKVLNHKLWLAVLEPSTTVENVTFPCNFLRGGGGLEKKFPSNFFNG